MNVYALSKINRYDPRRANFSAWLHTITVSRCRNKRRRRHLPLVSLTTWLKRGGDVPDPTPDQEQQVVQAEIHSEVWEAVQGLSPPLREAVILRYWAEILDCPIATAQSRVRLAYQRLRVVLAKEELTDIGDLEEERT